MSTLDKLIALGAQNCHPKVVLLIPGEYGGHEHQIVGEILDDEVYLTDAGRALLESDSGEKQPKKRAKRAADAEPVADDPLSTLEDL